MKSPLATLYKCDALMFVPGSLSLIYGPFAYHRMPTSGYVLSGSTASLRRVNAAILPNGVNDQPSGSSRPAGHSTGLVLVVFVIRLKRQTSLFWFQLADFAGCQRLVALPTLRPI